MAGRHALLGLLSVTLAAAQPADLRLVSAAREGKSGQAMRLVRDKADVNQRDERGYTPLIWAAAWGNTELAAALIERRARVNTAALGGATAFGIAAANGHDLIVRALIKAGSNCVSVEPGWNPQTGARGPLVSGVVNKAIRLGDGLMLAIAENDLHGVKSALEAGAPAGYAWNKHPYDTALMRAYGQVEIMRVLVAAGATVSDDHVERRSPFDYVDASVKPEVLRLLLEAKPPADVVYRAMRRPGVPRPEFGRYYEWNVQLARAVSSGSAAGVRQALDAGADPDTTFSEIPELVKAIRAQRTDIVQLLVSAGATLTEKEANSYHSDERMNAVLKPLFDRSRGIDPLVLSSVARIVRAGTSLPASADRDRILTAARWMAKKADESPGITGSYRHELEASAERLESPRARAEASAVADDLELKVAHCKALGIGMGGKVRVSVTTRRGNQVVNNWQVLYLPRIFQNAPGVAPGLMPKWTSPAEEMLEPGRYLLWARDPVSGKSTAPQVVPFSGRADIPVDLAVP